MDSKHLIKVLKLLKEVYPGQVWKETNLHNLVEGTRFSIELESLIGEADTDLRKMRVDLYVKGQIAIEVHGEQHNQPVKFANSILDPEEELRRRRLLDEVKRKSLAEAGVPFVVIWYQELESLTVDKLREKIAAAQEIARSVPRQHHPNVKSPKWRTKRESFEARQKRLARARKARKEAYRRAKARKKKCAP